MKNKQFQKESIFYHDQLDSIQKNEKISKHNTFIGKIVSEKTHAKKAIKNSNFENNYLPNIDKAIKRSQNFSIELLDLIDNLGTNLGSLIEEMRHFEE